MSRISEKVAYLDGLMEGLNIQEDKYAKIFTAIVDALDLIAEEISDHEDTLADLDDSVEEIFENLDEYDDFLYGDEDEDEEDEFDEDDFFEIVCPNCGETIYFDQDMLDTPDGLICPNCNEPIELNIPEKDPEA
ncbi:MAG: hypothetical protein IJI34_11180 [Clostridia bacterium]|jgi:hypothetical protein|nr:hypothetical protein [Clostridia bacterium]